MVAQVEEAAEGRRRQAAVQEARAAVPAVPVAHPVAAEALDLQLE